MFTTKNYEKMKSSYYGQTKYSISPLPKPPTFIQNIHSILIADYKNQHDYSVERLHNLIKERYKLLNIDLQYDFFEHCILHAANILPQIKKHYSQVTRVMFTLTPNQKDTIGSEFPVMSFYIGIDMLKTFGIGNMWPIFHDTIVPEIEKNLNKISDNYAVDFWEFDPSEDDEDFKNLQHCFFLNVECVTNTLLTNPIFTAQYLLEKENEFVDKMLVLSSCQYLLKEINSFINLKSGLPDIVTEPLVSKLTNLMMKYNSPIPNINYDNRNIIWEKSNISSNALPMPENPEEESRTTCGLF